MNKKDVQAAAKAVSGRGGEDATPPSPPVQLVAFVLDGEEYAVPIGDIREVVVAGDVVPVPSAPPFIVGLTNVRGRIVTVLDLERRFGLEHEGAAPERRHLLIAESGGSTYGIRVDRVPEVLHVPSDTVRPAADAFSAKIGPDYLAGVVVLGEGADGRILMLLALPKLLAQKELLKIGKIVQEDDSTSPPQP